MLEAAVQGLGVTLAMAPPIKAWPGFGKKLVAAFDPRPPAKFRDCSV
jgi:LysR family transcriptional regulator, glycine cleavage system transcriptional activator